MTHCKTKSGLTAPLVHLNGTSQSDLMERYRAASAALRDAIGYLEGTEPHSRDYYPQEEGAFAKARNEHVKRLAVLEGVRLELNELLEHVVDQKK